jgi:glycosyltransferase involved in cell wall biosynthesis
MGRVRSRQDRQSASVDVVTGSPALISIIVPVLNESSTVAAVIRRLLEIPLPAPREIIVVSDGSSDGTRGVLDGMAAVAEVRIVHVEPDRGLIAAGLDCTVADLLCDGACVNAPRRRVPLDPGDLE